MKEAWREVKRMSHITHPNIRFYMSMSHVTRMNEGVMARCEIYESYRAYECTGPAEMRNRPLRTREAG